MAAPSTLPSTVEGWQQRLDHDLPHGVIAWWETASGSPDHTYAVPRIEVLRMEGGDPYVLLPVPGWDKVVIGRVLSYTTARTEPCTVYRALLDHGQAGRVMLWSTGLSPTEVTSLADDRAHLIKLAAERGRSSYAELDDEEEP